MSGVTERLRRLAAQTGALARAVGRFANRTIGRPAGRLTAWTLRPLTRRRNEQAALARRIQQVSELTAPKPPPTARPRAAFGRRVLERFWSGPRERAERPAVGAVRPARPPTAPPGRFRAQFDAIDSQLARLVRGVETREFIRLGGRIDLEVDHARMIADVGLVKAVEFAHILAEIKALPLWRTALDPAAAMTQLRFVLTARSRGWLITEPRDGEESRTRQGA